MKKSVVTLPEMYLAGVTVRTSNASEMDHATAQIGATVQKYFQGGMAEQIVQRKKPGTTYSVYTEYESDVTGAYTYFIGEEIEVLDTLPDGFVHLTIPAQKYVKFTNGPGPMPDVCIQAWQQIWQMDAATLGGERCYQADFEVYDERAHDPAQVELDLYIGVKV